MEYAILDADNNCINRILWDGESPWQPPEGCTAVADPESTYSIPLPEPQPPADPLASLTDEQKLALIALLKS
jgi:hypothetical protein